VTTTEARQWAALVALSTEAFIDVVTDLAPAGLLPGMSAYLGVSEGQVGILVSGYATASALGAIPLTALLRRAFSCRRGWGRFGLGGAARGQASARRGNTRLPAR
jgi:predicted MFS family arabinose efflux permease